MSSEESTMAIFGEPSRYRIQRTHAHRFVKALALSAFLGVLTFASPTPADVSAHVSVTHTGFGRNRANGVWTATLTVKNTSGASIAGPIEVALTKLPANVTMVNGAGTRNGDPYVTVSPGALAAGASASAMIQFNNPSSGFIDFTPVTYSGN
jgi:hypothetical protein